MTRSPFKPLKGKQLIVECSISQGELGAAVGRGKSTINHIFNRGMELTRSPDYKAKIEAWLLAQESVSAWLKKQNMQITDIWQQSDQKLYKAKPADYSRRQRNGTLNATKHPAMVSGNPDLLNTTQEVTMLTQEAKKQFKLFGHPFIDDIRTDSDIFMSDEHRYIEAAFLDAARHGGFLAIVGEVGSGKSVIRRKVVEQLKRDKDVLVIYPQIIDKTRVTAASICDAIIMDISNETPRMKLEAKSRQVQRLLVDRAKNGYRHVLILEEAHDLTVPVLKYLKRFHELEDGYRKLLGIVMIAQTELQSRFEESQNVDMREVIQRVQIAEIQGLNGSLKAYLAVKFKRLNKELSEIFTDDAYDILSRRLSREDKGNRSKRVSMAYPLRVNDTVIQAMNLAVEMGEERVTGDVIEAL